MIYVPYRSQRKRLVDVVVRLHGPTDQVPNVRHLRVQHTFSSMTSSPSRSSRTGKVVDEFRQHDDVVTVLVKNNLRKASPKRYGNYDGGYTRGDGVAGTRLGVS